MSLANMLQERTDNPLDMLARAALVRDWMCERTEEDELVIVLEGRVSTYKLIATWLPEPETLHLSCTFELHAPALRKPEVEKLLLKAAGRLWFGHFEFWPTESLVVLRQGLMMAGGGRLTIAQLEATLETMSATCDRFYPAFHYVAWANLDADAALEVVTFGTEGEA